MFLLDSGSCMHNEAMHSHSTHTDTPTQSNLIHSRTYRHTKTPTQSPTHHISDKQDPLHSQFSLVIGCLVFNTTQVLWVYVGSCCYLFLFLMLFGCAAGEKNLFLFWWLGMSVSARWIMFFCHMSFPLSLAALEPFGNMKTNYLLLASAQIQ